MKINLLADKKKRKNFKKSELKVNVIKTLEDSFKNISLSSQEFYFLAKKKQQFCKSYSISRPRNFCLLTGRGRGVFLGTMSRHKLRLYFSLGLISSIKKIS